MNTDTPRTESHVFVTPWGEVVPAWLSQQLERELYDANADTVLQANNVVRLAHEIDTQRKEFLKLCAVAEKLAQAVQMQEDDLTSLMDESVGVAGLHLNGDVAPWRDIDESGCYERFSNRYFARTSLAIYEDWKGNEKDSNSKIPMTADGFPIYLGNTLFTQDPEQSYSTGDTIIEIKVTSLHDEVGFDSYNGAFTVGGSDYEAGNLEFYAVRGNVPRDDYWPAPQTEQENQEGVWKTCKNCPNPLCCNTAANCALKINMSGGLTPLTPEEIQSWSKQIFPKLKFESQTE